MSTIVMAACWPVQCSPSQKAVLISLADNANDHGYCWPSIAKICERTCLKKTAVIDAVGELENRGLLVVDRTNGRHSKYQLVINGELPIYPQPVRQTNRSVSRSGSADAPHRSATRTGPVRQTDTNHQEPSLTVKSTAVNDEMEISSEATSPVFDDSWRESLPTQPTRQTRSGAHRMAKLDNRTPEQRAKDRARNLSSPAFTAACAAAGVAGARRNR